MDASGHSIPELLQAILQLFPLDDHDSQPIVLMDMAEVDKDEGMQVTGNASLSSFGLRMVLV